MQLCTARTAWSDSDQAVRAMQSCNSWFSSCFLGLVKSRGSGFQVYLYFVTNPRQMRHLIPWNSRFNSSLGFELQDEVGLMYLHVQLRVSCVVSILLLLNPIKLRMAIGLIHQICLDFIILWSQNCQYFI